MQRWTHGTRVVVSQNTVFTNRFGDTPVPKGSKGSIVNMRPLYRANPSDIAIILDGAIQAIFVPFEHVELDTTHRR